MDVSVLQNPQEARDIRDENRRLIANEWNRFIAQMKLEGKYRQ
jgi:hypothetical protein